jgi:hypothetical protein
VLRVLSRLRYRLAACTHAAPRRAEPRICCATAAAVGFGVGSGVTYWLLAEGKLPLPARGVDAAVGAGAAAAVAAEALRHPAAAHGLPSGSETLRVRAARGSAVHGCALLRALCRTHPTCVHSLHCRPCLCARTDV